MLANEKDDDGQRKRQYTKQTNLETQRKITDGFGNMTKKTSEKDYGHARIQYGPTEFDYAYLPEKAK